MVQPVGQTLAGQDDKWTAHALLRGSTSQHRCCYLLSVLRRAAMCGCLQWLIKQR